LGLHTVVAANDIKERTGRPEKVALTTYRNGNYPVAIIIILAELWRHYRSIHDSISELRALIHRRSSQI
jgi:hypothetical protein